MQELEAAREQVIDRGLEVLLVFMVLPDEVEVDWVGITGTGLDSASWFSLVIFLFRHASSAAFPSARPLPKLRLFANRTSHSIHGLALFSIPFQSSRQ
jgi:hypothetical protein